MNIEELSMMVLSMQERIEALEEIVNSIQTNKPKSVGNINQQVTQLSDDDYNQAAANFPCVFVRVKDVLSNPQQCGKYYINQTEQLAQEGLIFYSALMNMSRGYLTKDIINKYGNAANAIRTFVAWLEYNQCLVKADNDAVNAHFGTNYRAKIYSIDFTKFSILETQLKSKFDTISEINKQTN